jgi:hypothetical protein
MAGTAAGEREDVLPFGDEIVRLGMGNDVRPDQSTKQK